MTVEAETEVEAQLEEYATALQGIDEAMKHDPTEELVEVRESLLAAVSELESALLEVKRSRLLASLSQICEPAPLQPSELEAAPAAEPLLPVQPSRSGAPPEDHAGTEHPPANANAPASGAATATVGAQCRFRYLDGRWYRGRVAAVEEGSGTASVSFEAPTRQYMLSGARVQLSSLRPPRGQAGLLAAEARAAPSGPAAVQTQQGGRPVPGSAKAGPAVGDRVYVRPPAGPPPLSPPPPLPLQLQGAGGEQGAGRQVLWQAATVVTVCTASAQAVVLLEQGGTRKRVSYADIVSEAWEGCSDLESDTDGEDDDGSDDEEGSSSWSGSEMDVCDVEGAAAAAADDDDECQGAGASGLGAPCKSTSKYGQRSRKRPRLEEPETGGGSVLVHVRVAAEAGATQDTKHFAHWEKHGRGIASRLMAKSGYTEGSGLGRQRSGIVAPVQALVLPRGQGLGLSSAGRRLGEDGEGGEAADGGPLKRKRRGGGERKRKAKHAAASREARDARHREQDARDAKGGAPGLFGFLNQALGDSSSTAAKIRDHQQTMFNHPADASRSKVFQGQHAGGKADKKGGAAVGADARTRLMRQQSKVDHCQARVAHFHEMLQRNRANPSLAAQISHRLKEVQAELAAEIAEQARMSKSITGQDNQKKMMKF